MSLDLYQDETRNRLSDLSLTDQPVQSPGVFDGFFRGSGMLATRLGVQAARTVSMAASAAPIAFDAFTGGTTMQDRYFQAHEQIFKPAVDYWTPKPGEVGMAAEVVGPLLGMLPMIFASPGSVVAATFGTVGEDLISEGAPLGKSLGVAGVQAGGLATGIWMPILGQTGWQRMLIGGAGFNVLQGAATRAASGAIMTGTQWADAFPALDPTMLTVDALLGLGFGAFTHLSPPQRAQGTAAWNRLREFFQANTTPEQRDALATMRVAEHLNTQTAPGRPAEATDLDAHVQRVRKAIDDLASDRPVRVEDLPEPRFEPEPERLAEMENRVQELARDAEDFRIAEDLPPAPDPEPARPAPAVPREQLIGTTARELPPEAQPKAIGQEIEQRLREIGADEKEARANGAIWSAFFETASARYGRTAADLVESYGLDIRKVAPSNEGRLAGVLDEALEQPAWHGSPAIFDRFSLHKIGTGEGAQAYGWGLYFSKLKEIGQWYREKLTSGQGKYRFSALDDTENDQIPDWVRNQIGRSQKPEDAVKAHIEDFEERLRDHQRDLAKERRKKNGQPEVSEDRIQRAKEIISALRKLRGRAAETTIPGRLYHVEIPDDDVMLDYNKPLTEQPPKVQAALREAGYLKEPPPRPKVEIPKPEWNRSVRYNDGLEVASLGAWQIEPMGRGNTKLPPRDSDEWVFAKKPGGGGAGAARVIFKDAEDAWIANATEVAEKAAEQAYQRALRAAGIDSTGADLYNRLARESGVQVPGMPRGVTQASPEAASRHLAEIGVKGIKYRGRTTNEENYVVFDDNLIQIQRFEQPAWHGAHAEIDKFSTQYIGTGEGAQVKGWGLYFSSKKAVGEWYRNTVTKRRSKPAPLVVVDHKGAEAAIRAATDDEQLIRAGLDYFKNRAAGRDPGGAIDATAKQHNLDEPSAARLEQLLFNIETSNRYTKDVSDSDAPAVRLPDGTIAHEDMNGELGAIAAAATALVTRNVSPERAYVETRSYLIRKASAADDNAKSYEATEGAKIAQRQRLIDSDLKVTKAEDDPRWGDLGKDNWYVNGVEPWHSKVTGATESEAIANAKMKLQKENEVGAFRIEEAKARATHAKSAFAALVTLTIPGKPPREDGGRIVFDSIHGYIAHESRAQGIGPVWTFYQEGFGNAPFATKQEALAFAEDRNRIQNPDIKEVVPERPKGRLYQVEIPEREEMLDWDRTLTRQAQESREAGGTRAPATKMSDSLYAVYAAAEQASGRTPAQNLPQGVTGSGLYQQLVALASEGKIVPPKEKSVNDPAIAADAELLAERGFVVDEAPDGTGRFGVLDPEGEIYADPGDALAFEADLPKDTIAAIDRVLLYLNRPSDPQEIASRFLLEHGIQGITYKGASSGERNFVVFDDSRIEITRYEQSQRQKGAIWYSELERQVDAANMKQAPAKAWLDMLKGMKGKGVKDAELEATGIREWLELREGKITKDQVLEYLQSNGVQVKEVELGGPKPSDLFFYEMNEKYGEGWTSEQLTPEEQARNLELWSAVNRAGERENATRYAGYQLPGAKPGSYRELLLTVPRTKPEPPEIDRQTMLPVGYHLQQMRSGEGFDRWTLVYPNGVGNVLTGADGLERWQATEEAIAHLRRAGAMGPQIEWNAATGDNEFRSSHFDTPNILAHVRFNERTDAEGKRVLFLEELQSDWAQKGRSEGFADPNNTGPGLPDGWALRRLNAEESDLYGPPVGHWAMFDDTNEMVAPVGNATMTEAQALRQGLAEAEHWRRLGLRALSGEKIPRAPFVTKTEAWTSLVLKRMVRYAAENGFDRIAWTRGEQQVERYNKALRQAVDSVNWTKTKDGVHLQGYKRSSVQAVTTAARNDADDAIMRNDYLGFDTVTDARAALRENAADWRDRWQVLNDDDADAIQNYLDLMRGQSDAHKVVDTTEKETELSDAIGKSMAEKILADPNQSGTIEGPDLKISDTGMAGYYDRIVPSVAKDVVKKLGGGKIGETKIQTGKGNAGDLVVEADRSGEPPIEVRDFATGGWDEAFAGAENFTNGDRPVVVETTLLINGEKYPVAIIADQYAIGIHGTNPVTDEPFSLSMLDVEDTVGTGRPWNARTATDLIVAIASGKRENLDWDLQVGELPTTNIGSTHQAFDITPAMRDAALAGMPLFQGRSLTTSPVALRRAVTAAFEAHGEDRMAGVNARVDVETAERLARAHDPDAGAAALAAYVSDDFTRINGGDLKAAGDALADQIKRTTPNSRGALYRVLAFETAAEARAFTSKFMDGGEHILESERPVMSFTTDNPAGQTPMSHIGLDVASQFGEHKVVIEINPAEANGLNGGRDISWAYGGKGVKPGLDVLVPRGERFKVDSITKGADGEPVIKLRPTNDLGRARLFQEESANEPRADIQFGRGRTLISLFEGADASSFLHETGHFFLQMTRDLATHADAPELAKQDWATLQKHLGFSGREIPREAHEQFARSFEAYLAEGKAPSNALAEVFSQFKNWLLSLYRSIAELDVNLTPELRGVFDRMLATAPEGAAPRTDGPIARDAAASPPPRVAAPEAVGPEAVVEEPPPWQRVGLEHEGVRQILGIMVESELGWEQIGGKLDHARLAAAGGKMGTVAFTEWIPKAEWWRTRPGIQNRRALNEAKIAAAVKKAMAGEKMTKLETLTVEHMIDVANERLASEQRIGPEEWNETAADVAAEDLSPTTQNVDDADLIARANEIDEAAVERAAMQAGEDDLAFMAAIREIVDGRRTAGEGQGAEAPQGGAQGGPAPRAGEPGTRTPAPDTAAAPGRVSAAAGPAGATADTLGAAGRGTEPPDPLTAAADRFASEHGELLLEVGVDEAGNPITMSPAEYLEGARLEAQMAREDTHLFEIAAECLLGGQ